MQTFQCRHSSVVEQQFCKLWVLGSNPSAGSKNHSLQCMGLEKEITKLYIKQQWSGVRIARNLNVSTKVVYQSLKRNGVARRTAHEANQLVFHQKPSTYNFKENLSVKERELMIAGVMLYWGEGAKTGCTVDFTNSDPVAVQVFLRFLREIARVEERKLRLYLYCFEDQSTESLMRFWSKKLGLPSSAFTKPYVRRYATSRQRSTHAKKPHGVIHLRYNDKRLLEKILQLCSDLVAAWAA